MPVKEILIYPDERLKQLSEPVDSVDEAILEIVSGNWKPPGRLGLEQWV